MYLGLFVHLSQLFFGLKSEGLHLLARFIAAGNSLGKGPIEPYLNEVVGVLDSFGGWDKGVNGVFCELLALSGHRSLKSFSECDEVIFLVLLRGSGVGK